MHVPSLIEAKRGGGELAAGDIHRLIKGYTQGDVPDYQMSAWAMAVFFRGMSLEETTALTEAMLNSGTRLQWPADAPLRADKHSTGGIGDKTSLVLAPLLACDGLWVPMISGRGLGITGGTLDKLESIPRFRTRLSEVEIYQSLPVTGCLMVGQTANLCPADRKLYALRDVSGTVQSVPLITASILCKKLAEGLDRLILDVKWGSGAFMQTEERAHELARCLVAVGRALGVRASVRLSEMNEPTGEAAGNALEVAECVRCLQGQGPPDLETLVLDLAAAVSISPRSELAAMLKDGRAWRKFQQMVALQKGRVEALEKLESLHRAPVIRELVAESSGVLRRLDAGCIGRAVLHLGGGRTQAEDAIDPAVGVDRMRKTGQEIHAGEVLLRIHARSQQAAEEAERLVRSGLEIT
ncbi:MAG TPA: thymidine phosphorylase [Prosthecobacter sp.]